MKSKYTFYIVALLNIFCWTSCLSDPDLPSDIINAKVPEVKTLQIDEQTATTITLSAEVLKENGLPITDYGVYWSKTTPIDTTTAENLSAGKGKGAFTIKIEGLDSDTEYYVAPYAKNKKGVGVGETETVLTKNGLGTVNTLAPQNLKATTVDLGGKIIGKGEGNIIQRGVYLSDDPKDENPNIIFSEMDRDSFICHVTGLSPNTKYYVKAFVENTFGIFHGDEKDFTTSDGLPQIDDLTKVEIGFYDATFKAVVKEEGDSPVTERGFCYKIEDGELPTIENDTILCGKGVGVFEGKIENLSNAVRYHVRAFAKNEFGVSYSNKDTIFSVKSDYPIVQIDQTVTLGKGSVKINAVVLDEGQSAVFESGICWSTSNTTPDLTDSDSVMPLSAGKQAFTAVIEHLTGGTTYYVRAYAKNSIKIEYSGTVTSFTTPEIYTDLKSLNEDRIQGSTGFFYTKEYGFLLGGDKGANYSNELWQYSFSLGEWRSMKVYPEIDIMYGQTPVTIIRTAYVFGGKKADSNVYTNLLYKYDTYNNAWVKVDNIAETPDPIAFTAGCNLSQSAYYVGGLRADSVCSEVNQYISLENKWLKRSNIPEAQYGGVALVVGNTIFAGLGVKNIAGTTNNKALWSSDNNGASWATRASIPNEASKIIGGVVYGDDNIYVVDNTGQIWKYSPTNDSWSKKVRLSALNDNIHCVYLQNDKICVGLGNGTGRFVAYSPYWDN